MNAAQTIKDIMKGVLKIGDEDVAIVKYAQHYSWDSLTHVILIAKIEESVSVRFLPEEIVLMTCFEQILNKTHQALKRK